jgi:peptide deformylase
MTILTILQYPDILLKRAGVKVENFDETFQTFVDDMFETHYATPNCAALAATQLDVPIPWSVTVIDYSQEKNQPLCLVNPIIISSEEEQNEYEGCMSVCPDAVHERVKRAMTITVQAQDRYGKALEINAEGFFAKCIQHEVDHLHGKLFIDRLHKITHERVIRKIKKQQRLDRKKE